MLTSRSLNFNLLVQYKTYNDIKWEKWKFSESLKHFFYLDREGIEIYKIKAFRLLQQQIYSRL